MNSLEAIVIDYVRLFDKLSAARRAFVGDVRTGTLPTANTQDEIDKVLVEIGKLSGEVDSMLAALRSQARAVYDTALKD